MARLAAERLRHGSNDAARLPAAGTAPTPATPLARLSAPSSGGPPKGDAEQAAFEQEGVRVFFVLREVRAVGAIDGGEEGVFAIGISPAEADEIERKAHGAGGLVTGDARASVGAEWGEEGVILRLDFA